MNKRAINKEIRKAEKLFPCDHQKENVLASGCCPCDLAVCYGMIAHLRDQLKSAKDALKVSGEAISLLNSMVLSGESHSQVSLNTVQKSLTMAADVLA